jgi:hypothetical protein
VSGKFEGMGSGSEVVLIFCGFILKDNAIPSRRHRVQVHINTCTHTHTSYIVNHIQFRKVKDADSSDHIAFYILVRVCA